MLTRATELPLFCRDEPPPWDPCLCSRRPSVLARPSFTLEESPAWRFSARLREADPCAEWRFTRDLPALPVLGS